MAESSYPSKGDWGLPPIVAASMDDDVERVAKLLQSDASLVGYKLDGLDTPLHCAAETDARGVAALLIERGAALNVRGASGMTPLHRAAGAAHAEMVRLLLDNGADAVVKDGFGCTPLVLAARRFDAEGRRVARQMIKGGVRYDLHAAVCLGDTSAVAAILAKQPHLIHEYDRPADLLLDAILFIQGKALDFGADGTQRALSKYGQICKMLVNAGVSPDEDSHWMGPILHEFIELGCAFDTIQFLLQLGANPHVLKADEDALDIASRKGRTDVIALLRQDGAE